jgi:hypothetical protein
MASLILSLVVLFFSMRRRGFSGNKRPLRRWAAERRSRLVGVRQHQIANVSVKFVTGCDELA